MKLIYFSGKKKSKRNVVFNEMVILPIVRFKKFTTWFDRLNSYTLTDAFIAAISLEPYRRLSNFNNFLFQICLKKKKNVVKMGERNDQDKSMRSVYGKLISNSLMKKKNNFIFICLVWH